MKAPHSNFLVLVPESSWQRRRRSRRRSIIAGGILLLLAVAFAIKPVGRELRTRHAQKLAREGLEFLQKGEFKKAAAAIEQASRLDPVGSLVLRSEAKFLTATGNFSNALTLWKELAVRGNSFPLDDVHDYAEAAYHEGDLALAFAQIERLKAGREGLPADWLLEAQLRERSGDPDAAAAAATRVLSSNTSSEKEILTSSTLVLANATESPARTAAWAALAKVAQGKSALALEALLLLSAEQLGPADAAASGVTGDLPGKIDSLEKHPLANATSILRATDLRIKLDPSERDRLIDQAVARLKEGSDADLGTLCLWLLAHKKAVIALGLLTKERVSGKRELSEARMESLCALGEWSVLADELQDPASGLKLDDVTVQIYLARGAARLGAEALLRNSWDRAFELAAGNRSKLLYVGRAAEAEQLFDKAETAYRALIEVDPRDRGAYAYLLRLTINHGGAAKAFAILQTMQEQWPNDPGLRNGLTYTGLLSGKYSPEEARQSMEPLVREHPSNSAYRATLALAWLRLGQPGTALQALGDSTNAATAGAPGTSTLAVHAVVLAANDMLPLARADLEKLTIEELSPEERTLVQPLVDQLTSAAGPALPFPQ